MASDRESKIPPTGDLIRGVPAPAGTWPDHQTSSGVSPGKITRFPIVLVGSEYWRGLVAWLREKAVAEGNIHAEELDLFTIVDEPEEVVKVITRAHAEADFLTPGSGTDSD